MEILVARLDFSLLDCRGAGPRGISQKALHEAVSSGETLFLRDLLGISWECQSETLKQHSHEEFLLSFDYRDIKEVYSLRAQLTYHLPQILYLRQCTPSLLKVTNYWANEQEVNRRTQS